MRAGEVKKRGKEGVKCERRVIDLAFGYEK